MSWLIYLRVLSIIINVECRDIPKGWSKPYCHDHIRECVLDGEAVSFCANSYHEYMLRSELLK